MRSSTLQVFSGALPLCLLLALTGCSGGSDDGETTDSGSGGSTSGGSTASGGGGTLGPPATCEDWKDAYCSLLGECAGGGVQCAADLADETCDPTADLDDCVTALSQGCSDIPTHCDPADIVDTNEPINRCYALQTSFCESFAACDSSTTYSACVAEVGPILYCEATVYTGADYDLCIDELTDASCETTLPLSCSGVILQ